MNTYTSLSRYSLSCPYLHKTSTATLRTLATSAVVSSTTASNNGNGNGLVKVAMDGCPVMGPRLLSALGLTGGVKAEGQKRGYAAVAGRKEVEEIHKVSFE